MTITYTASVATAGVFGCFWKLLGRWRGSVYKAIWSNFLVFISIYYLLALLYLYVLNEGQKELFKKIVAYCKEQSKEIPLSFVLGFYVSLVMTRWWAQYTTLAWPDSIATFVSATVHGNDEKGRLMRRTIVRYVSLCLAMVLASISPRVKKRFPTLKHFIDAGLLLENESKIIDDLNLKFPKSTKYWMPIVWAASIVTRARKEGKILNDFAVNTLLDELNKFRGNCGRLISFDTISIPLVYTQVVTLAVYSYFLTLVMGNQWVTDQELSLYRSFPVFTMLHFFFYMGWLKVAEILINPFGEDEEDFEVNWLIDRNLQVSYLIVDEMHSEHPELIRDQYWDEVFPTEIPYTAETVHLREQHPMSSTANIQCSNIRRESQPSSHKGENFIQNFDYDKFHRDLVDDENSGIYFTAGAKFSRSGSRTSKWDQNSESGTPTLNSITQISGLANILKRLLGREYRSDSPKMPSSPSGTSLPCRNIGMTNEIDVIEEVDEKLSSVSSIYSEQHLPRGKRASELSSRSLSTPINIPRSSTSGARSHKLTLGVRELDLVTPGSSHLASRSSSMNNVNFVCGCISDSEVDKIITKSFLRNPDEDLFEQLKIKRAKQRKDKALKKFARSWTYPIPKKQTNSGSKDREVISPYNIANRSCFTVNHHKEEKKNSR